MVSISNKTFHTIIGTSLQLAIIGGVLQLFQNPTWGFFIVTIHGGLYVGIWKRYDWIIGGLRLWGIALVLYMIYAFVNLIQRVEDVTDTFILTSMTVVLLSLGSYSFFFAPRYIKKEEQKSEPPTSSRGGAP